LQEFANILSTVSAPLLELRLNRPERLNILDLETRHELLRALRENERNANVKCVVFRSTGRAFSAGADIKYLRSLDKRGAARYSRFVQGYLSYIETYPKPTIGVVEGIAMGGGLELLMTLDIVIATKDAKFGQTELNVGMIPGGGGTQRLPRIVGVRRAKEMLFTGELLGAEEGARIGLVNMLVEPENLERTVSEIVESVAKKSPLSLRLAKEAVNRGFKGSLGEGLEVERRLYLKSMTSSDGKEGLEAFLAKREPRYKGA